MESLILNLAGFNQFDNNLRQNGTLLPIISLIFSAAGFNQFGLYHDDALHENAEVKEALSRLPQVPFSATV